MGDSPSPPELSSGAIAEELGVLATSLEVHSVEQELRVTVTITEHGAPAPDGAEGESTRIASALAAELGIPTTSIEVVSPHFILPPLPPPMLPSPSLALPLPPPTIPPPAIPPLSSGGGGNKAWVAPVVVVLVVL